MATITPSIGRIWLSGRAGIDLVIASFVSTITLAGDTTAALTFGDSLSTVLTKRRSTVDFRTRRGAPFFSSVMMPFQKTQTPNHAEDKSPAAIIAEMQTYLQQFLETPHPQFGGLHICPFFKKARLQKKIEYHVHPFSSADLAANSDLLQRIEQFGRDRQKQVFLCIHPIKQGISFAETDRFVQSLNPLIQALDLIAFGGHPDDPFNVNGVYTRVTPYVNFTVQFKADLTAATKALLQTDYYKHWSPENLKYIGFPRDGV